MAEGARALDPLLGVPVFGHRFRFSSDGATMPWRCARGWGAEGAKTYATVGDAERYARAFDREDREDLGRRAPFFGLLPLRLAWALRERRAQT
jgi:hypothetical protein